MLFSIVFFIGKNNNKTIFSFFNDGVVVVVGADLSVPAFKELWFYCFLFFN